jgi:hypothetical protein
LTVDPDFALCARCGIRPAAPRSSWDVLDRRLFDENAGRLAEWVKGLCLRCIADEIARQSEWGTSHVIDPEDA